MGSTLKAGGDGGDAALEGHLFLSGKQSENTGVLWGRE